MSEQEKNKQTDPETEDNTSHNTVDESMGQSETAEDNTGSNDSAEESIDEAAQLGAKVVDLEKQVEKSKNEYLFLMAEFDNFRKRTVKEKMEIIKNATEKAMLDILPVIDDFERALQAMNDQADVDSLKEGVDLIYNKFVKYLESNGVKAIESNKAEFDTELHEAVANFPTPEEDLKGKVIDTVQKGYKINDKVLRHAKVVVGQ